MKLNPYSKDSLIHELSFKRTFLQINRKSQLATSHSPCTSIHIFIQSSMIRALYGGDSNDGLVHITSTDSLHRKFTELIEMDLITTTFKDSNRRTKYVVLTPNGREYFKKLGHAFNQTQGSC